MGRSNCSASRAVSGTPRIVAFGMQRDAVYLTMTSVVLALLILSFLLGRISH